MPPVKPSSFCTGFSRVFPGQTPHRVIPGYQSRIPGYPLRSFFRVPGPARACDDYYYGHGAVELSGLGKPPRLEKLEWPTVTPLRACDSLAGICKPNRYNIVQNVVQFVQYCNLVPIRTICTICTTTFTNIVQKVSINVVQSIRKGFELIVQPIVQCN